MFDFSIEILGGIVGGVVGASVALYITKKKAEKKTLDVSEFPNETIEVELAMTDVVGWFQQKMLQKGVHSPFVAQGNEVFEHILTPESSIKKEGYDTTFMGVYNEQTEEIEDFKIVFSKGRDKELQKMFGDKNLVVLE